MKTNSISEHAAPVAAERITKQQRHTGSNPGAALKENNTMSAYIVEKNHIIYLVAAAMSRRMNPYGGFSFYHGNPLTRGELACSDYERAAEIGNMLWRENIASVSHRYPGESSDTLPGPTNHDGFVITLTDITRGCFDEIEPAQVLKSCHCYSYQSCEHPGWESSEAHAFIKSLEGSAAHAVPGYEEATWGAPEPTQGQVILGALPRRRRAA